MLPWLCHLFNENSCMLKIDMMKNFSVSSYDVQDIFMLPNVTENKLTYQLRKQPIAKMVIQKEWKKKLGIQDSEDIFVNNLENKIKSLKEGGDDFKKVLCDVYATSNFIHDAINLNDENEESEKEEEKEKDKNEEEKDENKEEKEENKEEKEQDEKEKEKDEKQQEKEAEVSVAVDANTANQPVDGGDIDEQPNEDLTNVVSRGDGDKQPVAEETIVLKNIQQEIASKININVDCGEKDVEVNFVSKSMRSNKSRMNEMPELYQVVVDYCFVKYSAFKHEELMKYEAPLMITRDDTVSLAPTAPPPPQMIKSNIVQCWSFLMNDSRLKEDPSCFFFGIDHNRPLELSLMSQDPSQPTLKTDEKEITSPSTHAAEVNQAWEYDDRHKPFYKILASLVVEEMSNFLKRINHEKADEILDYEFDEVKFKWKTPKYTLDCGVFTMMHMLCFTGDPFDSNLDLANRRKVYRAEICAALALAEINTKRKSLVEKVSRFRVVRKLEQDKEVKDMIYVSDFLKTHKKVMENMSLKCNQVIDYLAINDDENFPNKREDCNTLHNEWKASTNLTTTWSNHLNNNERQKERSENDMVRFFFGLDFMDAFNYVFECTWEKGSNKSAKTMD
uniref:Ubiquitin-like protease family profile domain-containing protein n=1 Tax=Chenopodium quinoa TaxID=63459 RepID=A0A803LVK5_CHEQI